MAMCVQEKDIIKVSNGGTINYSKDNKKKNFNAGSSSKSQGKDSHAKPVSTEKVHSRERSMSLLQED
jgi:hypothetical protein